MATYLIRECNWYLPFVVYVGTRRCELDKICFFDKDGVFATTGGFFDNYKSKNVKSLELNTDCVMKRKEDFSLKTAFVMSNGKDPYNGAVSYTLYIPADVLDLDYKESVESNPTHAYDIKRTWTSKVNPLIEITNYEYIKCGVSEALSNLKETLKNVAMDVSATTSAEMFNNMLNKIVNAYDTLEFAKAELTAKIADRNLKIA